MGTQAKVQVWMPEGILEEEFLSFPYVHPEAATQTPDLLAKAFSSCTTVSALTALNWIVMLHSTIWNFNTLAILLCPLPGLEVYSDHVEMSTCTLQ